MDLGALLPLQAPYLAEGEWGFCAKIVADYLEWVSGKKLKLHFFFPASKRCKHVYCHLLPFLAVPSHGNSYFKYLPHSI